MGDLIARQPKRKRPNPNGDRTEVSGLMLVRFQGMTPVSDGDKKDLWRFLFPRGRMRHRRTVGLDIPCQVARLQSLTPLLQARGE
jgi:hypothetical protein